MSQYVGWQEIINFWCPQTFCRTRQAVMLYPVEYYGIINLIDLQSLCGRSPIFGHIGIPIQSIGT